MSMEPNMEPKAEGWLDHSTESTFTTGLQEGITQGQIGRALEFLEGDPKNPEHVKIAIDLIKAGREKIKNSQRPRAEA